MGGGDGDGRREGGRRREERSSVQFSSPSRPFLLTDFSLARAAATMLRRSTIHHTLGRGERGGSLDLLDLVVQEGRHEVEQVNQMWAMGNPLYT